MRGHRLLALLVIPAFVLTTSACGDETVTGGSDTNTSTTISTPPTSTTTTVPPTTTTTTITPPYPRTAEEAAAAFGVPDGIAHYQRIGQFGWHTELSVRLRLYPGLCVDFDLNADPKNVLTGETEFIDKNERMHRALMKSAGSILGGATVYWSTCNRL